MAGKRKKAARRRALWTSAAAVAALMAAPVAYAQEQTHRFDIPSQPLSDALLLLGDQARLSITAPSGEVNGRTSPAISGEMTVREALTRLLNGTGLRFEFVAPNAVRVVSDAPDSLRRADQRGAAQGASEEEIIVVGTNLRGVYPASSPVEIFTAEDIERTGATTTEQFVLSLPQNLPTRTQFAPASSANTNREGVNTIDLRGLGVGTTLLLFNGRRAGMSANGQAMDISMIPLSAIGRVEVLTDGASAVYGSDAIGGVVNFVLRDDFEGFESRFTFAGVSRGDLRQGQASLTGGGRWNGGRILGSYSHYNASSLNVLDRSYSAPVQRGMLTPEDTRHSALVTVSQQLGPRLTIEADVFAALRDVKSETRSDSGLITRNRVDTEQYFANLSADYRLTDSLNASVTASYATTDVDHLQIQSSRQKLDTEYSAFDWTAKLDGSLVSLPAGPVRFAIGAGRLAEDYLVFPSAQSLSRETRYAFGELLVPLVSEAQDVPFVHRLELSIAARYTEYDDESSSPIDREFGGRTSPKLGILWSPAASLNLRATYGESFRAPFLNQLNPSAGLHQLTRPVVNGVQTVRLNPFGPSPDLGPELAQSYTLGFDLRPETHPRLRVSATYFNIEYKDRIAAAIASEVAANPERFPDVYFMPDNPQVIEEILRTTFNVANLVGVNLSDPMAAAAELFAMPNFVILDARLRNQAETLLDGVDFTFSNGVETGWGDVTFGGSFTYIFDFTEQSAQGSPVRRIVDTVLRPVDLRGRVFAGLTRGAWTTTATVNYVDDYKNPLGLGGGRVDSWTTFDWSLAYASPAHVRGALGGVAVQLSVQNVFDEDPPRVERGAVANVSLITPVGFDPANHNPLGRFISLRLSKSW